MRYRSDQVQQILQRALTLQQEHTVSREQLTEMATELGISPEHLALAEQEWLAQRQEEQERQAFNAVRRSRFRSHLVPFLAVNTFLGLINSLTGVNHFWAVYPLLGWGLGLFFHGWNAYRTEGEGYDRRFQRWRQRQQPKGPALPS